MRHTLKTIVFFLMLASSSQVLAADSAKAMGSTEPLVCPNILFIITDQQSAESMSCVLGDKYLQQGNPS